MSYPFVQAKWYTLGGIREVRALVIHMAEGGGTVSWLTHPSGDNSADYVIEYSGRIVQMVRDQDYSHSLHWDTAHNTAPDCSTFSFKAASDLAGIPLGTFPLPYIKAVEIEGYAKDGPNAAQWKSLREDLIPHVRRTFPKCRGLLGHRDFMGYKACPGCHIFDRIKHGPWEEDELVTVTITPEQGSWRAQAGDVVQVVDAQTVSLVESKTFASDTGASYDARVQVNRVPDGKPEGSYVRVSTGLYAGKYLSSAPLTLTPTPVPPADCTPLQAKIDAAKAALA